MKTSRSCRHRRRRSQRRGASGSRSGRQYGPEQMRPRAATAGSTSRRRRIASRAAAARRARVARPAAARGGGAGRGRGDGGGGDGDRVTGSLGTGARVGAGGGARAGAGGGARAGRRRSSSRLRRRARAGAGGGASAGGRAGERAPPPPGGRQRPKSPPEHEAPASQPLITESDVKKEGARAARRARAAARHGASRRTDRRLLAIRDGASRSRASTSRYRRAELGASCVMIRAPVMDGPPVFQVRCSSKLFVTT